MQRKQEIRRLTYDPASHATLLADYCLGVQAEGRILVAGSTLALTLVQEFTKEILKRGARPVVRLNYPGQDDDFAAFASDVVLDHIHPADLADVRSLDGSSRILAPEPHTKVSAARQARLTAARAPLATERARKKWSLTLFPTPHAAEQAGMPEADFEDFVMRALFLDLPDPPGAWIKMRDRQAILVQRLNQAKTVHIQAPGTDLTLSVAGRKWINSDGKRNMPSGEVFTGPLENSAEGIITFTIPAEYNGRLVRGAQLTFHEGKVTYATADEGEDVLQAALDTDAGARLLGELGIGTNYGIQTPTGNILFDEKIGGTVHLAIGKSYPETGGTNTSAIHWDLITDLRQGGSLTIDGEIIQESGKFIGY